MCSLRRLVVGAAVVACACSSFAYNSGSYVQDGLIAHWDGIDNVGRGFHDPLSKTWKDLAGSYHLPLTANGSWTGGAALSCNGCSANYGAIGPTAYQTIEIVYRQAEKQSKSAGIVFTSGHNYRMGFSGQNGTSFWFRGNTDKHIFWDSMDGARRSVAAVYKDTSTACALSNVFVKGEVVVNAKSVSESWNAGDCKLMLGDRATGATYPFKGEICAIRLYSRGLTDEEFAANYKVDSVRYLGATPDDVLSVCGSPYDVPVAISPSYAGRDGLASGDTLTLTAPSGEITLTDGQKVTCKGYKLYDAAGAVVAEGTDLSYDYTHPGEFRRFEWQFEALCPVSIAGEDGEYSVTNTYVACGDDFTFTIYPNEGKYVKTVSNSYDSETWSKTVVTKRILAPTDFMVTYAQTYYVSPDGDDSLDGKTRANAKKTIASAVASAAAGDAVALTAGEHAQPSAAVTLNKAVTVYGEEGVEKTFIKLTADVTVFSLSAAGATVRGITFYSDYKTKVGCPISMSAAALAEDCVIRDAYIVHTPVYMQGASTIRNIRIEHVKGDGRYMTGLEISDALAVAENCSVIACEGNNNAYGCPAYIWSGTIRNCLFACNTNKSSQTSGVYISGAGTLENCTVVDNVCLGSGTSAGGVVAGTSGLVRNCLIAGNGNRSGAMEWSGSESCYTYSCTTPVPSGTGNVLATSPDFTDRAGKDYTLKSGNAIDAGVSATWQAAARDLAGNLRVIGSAVDIGCYEYKPGALAASAAPSVPSLVGEGTVTLQAHAAGTNLTDVAYTWTVTDDAGETVVTDTTSGATFAHAYGYGRYTVRLEVRNAAGETATWTAPKAFAIISTTVYVATDSTPTYPYATKATAANDLATALDATIDGSTVVICDGVYPVSANIAIAKNVTVRSENGADKVALTTDKAIRVVSVSASGARLENVTFRSDGKKRNCSAFGISAGTVSGCVVSNFYDSGSELIALSGTGAVVSNCLVTANHTTSRINTVHMGGGTVTHSKIVGNLNDNNTYGAAVMMYSGVCLVRNCLIASNTNLSSQASAFGPAGGSPASGSLVESCTIVGNHVADSSVNAACRVHANVKVRNCVIVDNTNTGGEANWDTTVANISYTCTSPVPDGTTGNVAPSGVLFADDTYHIKAGVLTDAGQNQPWMTDGFDLDGNARLFDGGTVDLGCYEYVPGALECSAAPSVPVRIGAGEVVLTAITSVTGDDMVYTWCVTNQFGESVAEVSGKQYANFTNSYPIGAYSVALRVVKGEQTAEFAQEALFSVKPEVVYVTKDSTPAYPYDTKATAFNQVDEALGFAESGMTVIVTDGVYTNATNPTISKDVTVVSENGAGRTRVCGVNETTAWTLNSPGVVVKGLTLFGDWNPDAANPSGHGAHGVSVMRGTLTDCVITNWYSYYTEVLAVGGSAEAGVITNCLVAGNKANYRTHFCYVGKNALMANCRVVGNLCDTASRDYGSIIATYGYATIRSTLVAANASVRTDYTDGKAYASVIDNRSGEPTLIESCTIVSNTSSGATSPAIWCESNGTLSTDYAKKLTIRNCIVWGNVNKTGVLDWKDIAACFTACCCSTPGLGAGNLTDNPKLRLRGTLTHPRFSLYASSPCVDAGVEQGWMTGAEDPAGNPRIIGEAPDIGCYECPPAPGLTILVR